MTNQIPASLAHLAARYWLPMTAVVYLTAIIGILTDRFIGGAPTYYAGRLQAIAPSP